MSSGKPVKSETSRTARPAPASAFRVPPVDTSSIPKPARPRAKSIRPVLSETEIKARAARRRPSGMVDTLENGSMRSTNEGEDTNIHQDGQKKDFRQEPAHTVWRANRGCPGGT